MNEIAGVVVTYRPDATFGACLEAIVREVKQVLIIDNTADAATESRLRTLAARTGAELIIMGENAGLGAALNRGFAVLAERGNEWVVAFDQDSTPEPGLAAALKAVAQKDATTAIVGANWEDEARPGFDSRHLRRNQTIPVLFERRPAREDLDDLTCVITSGSLFRVQTWRDLGGFDPGLFLDLVDTDYCLRAVRAGRTIRVAAAARLLHRRGNKRAVRFLGRTWWPAFMPPLRLRYLFRNRIHLVRRHAVHVPHWVSFELTYTAKILAEIVLLEDGKLAKLAACARGTWEGLWGRSGRVEASVAEKAFTAAEPP